jgi:hypothetical protein
VEFREKNWKHTCELDGSDFKEIFACYIRAAANPRDAIATFLTNVTQRDATLRT